MNIYQGFRGTLSVPSQTQSAGTAIVALVPPGGAWESPPLVYRLQSGKPNWYNSGYTRLTSLIYTTGATAHAVTVLRPLNWCIVNGAVAKNATSVVLATDPGLYSTNYKYPLPAGQSAPANVADNGIANTDYIAVQLTDGTWHFSKVSSVSTLTLTLATATPNVTGGGIADQAILFFFGQASDSDPATNTAHWNTPTIASTNKSNLIPDSIAGGVASLHQGDPLVVYSNNITAAGALDGVFGAFSRF